MRVAIDGSNFIFGLTSGRPVYRYHLIGGLLEASPDVQLVLLYHHRRTRAADAVLERLAGFPAERIDVVPEARRLDTALPPERVAARIAEVRCRYGLQDAPYIPTVGTLEPRKNHVRLVRAFEGLRDAFSQVRLAVVGGAGWNVGPIRRAFEESPARDRIRVLGVVSPEDLAALYAGASLFAYPSLYEGFGLPVLEAMAMGVPVVTSSVSSLPEVAGDAAILVDPRSVEAIRHGLARPLGDAELREELARRGRARERTFTWRRTAELTLASYERAIRDRQRRPAGAARR